MSKQQQNLYSKIYGKTFKENTPSKQAQIKAEQLKNQLGKYALYGTALLGTAALQEIPTAEAAIVHNFGSFAGATNNYNTGSGGSSLIPVSANISLQVYNNAIGNTLLGNVGSNSINFVASGSIGFSIGYLQKLTTGDIVSGSGTNNRAAFANFNTCTGDGGQNWLTSPSGYIGFTMNDGKNGWARVTFNCGSGGSTVIHEFAYEDVPGVPIQVGSTVSLATNASPGIPTLSEWGLINLALLLMTFGTIYLIDPSFSLRKKKAKAN